MSPTVDAFLLCWSFDPWLVCGLLVTALLYLRGWLALRRGGGARWQLPHLLAFLAGLLALFLALCSPLDAFAPLLLQAHMAQHLLLMMVVPALVWLGAPLVPLLRGLPQPVRDSWVAPLFRWPWLRQGFTFLTHPVTAWLLFAAATWGWHVPAAYELALRWPAWHAAEHASFLLAGLLFWYPVVRPFPSRPSWSPWLLPPYLLLADLQNTALSALLAFSEGLLYPHYAQVARLAGSSALDDQSAAGVLMWVPGSVAYLLPLGWVGLRLFFAQGANQASSTRKVPLPGRPSAPAGGRVALPVLGAAPARAARFDLLTLPVIGPLLRWRHARLALQVPLLLLAALMIYDGLTGPQVAPLNLAGVLPWIHWRGLVVLGLLAGGNVFCLACPFLVPRTLARRWLRPRLSWPRWLRTKWLAAGALVFFFWAYETFGIWASPWWTAGIALGYFALAFAVDALFRGAAFCKYLCPIGQFHFVHSVLSPAEVAVRDPSVCDRCASKDCIRGREGIPGCELGLYQPRKVGNLDCTFCLDCVHACPHGNVGIVSRPWGSEFGHDRHRSGVGRLSRRPDLAAVALVLVFAAFVNAAGMVAPVLGWRDAVIGEVGLSAGAALWSVGILAALVVVPLLTTGTAAWLGRWLGGGGGSWREVGCRFAWTLVPLGFGMWLAHYGFHFVTGAGSAVAVAQRCATDWGIPFPGAPAWSCDCCAPVATWLLRLEIAFLDGGLLASLYFAYWLGQKLWGRRALAGVLPWAAVMVLLFALGVWIIFQPMEMRGAALSAR